MAATACIPRRKSTETMMLALVACAVFTCAFLAATPVQAQHGGPAGHGAPAAGGAANTADPQGPFGVRAYGVFRDMVQGRDYQPKVGLGAVKTAGATDAVGALAGLRGEITMLDGRFVVSYGGGCATCPPPHEEKATLLATGKVAHWAAPIALPEPLNGKALEAFILGQAAAAGLNTSKPFPLRLQGLLTGVSMHVLKAPNDKFTGHGSAHPMAEQDEIRVAEIAGDVVGFYAPPPLSGVITHPGDAFHFHWVDAARTKTAHIDAFGMAKGATLTLPKPR